MPVIVIRTHCNYPSVEYFLHKEKAQSCFDSHKSDLEEESSKGMVIEDDETHYLIEVEGERDGVSLVELE